MADPRRVYTCYRGGPAGGGVRGRARFHILPPHSKSGARDSDAFTTGFRSVCPPSLAAAPSLSAVHWRGPSVAPLRHSEIRANQRATVRGARLSVLNWDFGHPQQAAPAAAVAAPGRDLRSQTSVDLEGGPLPLNTHSVGKAGKEPFIGKVLEIRRLGGRDSERDVSELVIDTGGVKFVEGQSFGVLPPGTKLNSKGQEVPQHVRLYSIASSRYGDRYDGQTCTLCVVRVVWNDPETGELQRGVCSNYISDRKVGDEMIMTGPSGTAMLLPDNHMQRPIVCVSTGTGIAPFRSFWRRLFYDCVPGQEAGYQGKFWLLAGFANDDSVLYGDELRAARDASPDRMRLDIALSLQQKNKRGGLLCVQDLIEENDDEFLALMASTDCLFYFCGLKRMYSSVMEVLERMGQEKGVDTAALITKLKKEHRWHVETA